MRSPDLPLDEAERGRVLADHGILDTPPEATFDALAELAAQLLDAPIALVSLVDRERQWFKAKLGLDAGQIARDVSFCGHVVARREALLVPDAREDPRFADNPLVVGPPHVRLYAGAPLETVEGHVLGTLCVFDRNPRALTRQQLRSLKLLAGQAAALLQLRRTEQNLARERARLQANQGRLHAVFESMVEGVVLAEGDGDFTRLNPAAERILAGSSDGVAREVTRGDGTPFPRHEWPLVQALQDGTPAHGVVMGLHRSGAEVRWVSVNAARLPATDGPPGAIATFQDVTERMRAEALLRRSEASFRALVASVPIGVVVLGTDTVIRYINAALLKTLGYEQSSDVVGRSGTDLLDPSSRQLAKDRFERLERGEPLPAALLQCYRSDGSLVCLESTMVAAEFHGQPARIALMRDVTEQLRIEDAKAKVQDELRCSVAEKETLLQEVHHRVKNNLQVVASLLSIQSRLLSDPAAQQMFLTTRHRVQAIALLHEGLYRSQDLASIPVTFYLRGLTQELVRAHARPGCEIDVVCSGDELCVDMNTAVPLGLIANELVTNSLKHAFVGRAAGSVQITVERRDQFLELRVSDDGPGLPDVFHTNGVESLGLNLVTNLAEQLDGHLTHSVGPGASWKLRFPLDRESS